MADYDPAALVRQTALAGPFLLWLRRLPPRIRWDISLGGILVQSTCWTALLLLAEDAHQSPLGTWTPVLYIWVPIGILFYFLLIRPQRREQAKRSAMLAALKKNDRVITAGGIYGVVANVHQEADEVTLKVDETTNTKLRVTLGSISRVLEGNLDDSSSK